MKRIWLMLVMICSVCAFTACSDDDDNENNEGNGGTVTPVCPVTNVSIDKTTAQIGDQVILSGKGFATTAKLYLKKTEEIALKGIAITSDGSTVTFHVPEVEEGVYNIVLEQEGKWTLDPTLTVEKKEVVKKLTSWKVDLFEPINFTFNYTDGKLTSVTQTVEGKAPYDYFTMTYGHDSVYITMNANGARPRSQGYIVYEGNYAKACNTNEWKYNNGYLTTAATGTMIPTNFTYTYEAGNLMKWNSTYMNAPTEFGFKYEGKCPSIKGIDAAALCGIILSGNYSNAILAAHFLEICGNISAQLPSTITGTKTEITFDENDQRVETKTDVTCNITDSSVDGDGYITKVVIDDQFKSNKELTIEFTWE